MTFESVWLSGAHLIVASPVEGPVEQEGLGGPWQGGWVALIGFERLRDDGIQPGGPLLQRVLLLQGGLEVLLQPLHHAVLALAHPGRLLLHVVEVDPVEVREHLVNLGRVVQDGARGLRQVIEAGVAAQGLGEGVDAHHLGWREGGRDGGTG